MPRIIVTRSFRVRHPDGQQVYNGRPMQGEQLVPPWVLEQPYFESVKASGWVSVVADQAVAGETNEPAGETEEAAGETLSPEEGTEAQGSGSERWGHDAWTDTVGAGLTDDTSKVPSQADADRIVAEAEGEMKQRRESETAPAGSAKGAKAAKAAKAAAGGADGGA